MRKYWLALVLLTVTGSALAETTPIQWLEKMNAAYHQSNFSLSIIHLQRNHIQSFSFEHGIVGEDKVVYINSLTGPVSHSYRINNQVTYIDPEIKPYRVESATIVIASPAFFVDKEAAVIANYQLTLGGQGRVAGRAVQLLRLTAKDEHRFNYILWLDVETSLLLRYDSYDLNNNLIEQMQAITFELRDQPDEKLVKLVNSDLKNVVKAPQVSTSTRWQFNWLPSNFSVAASDSHRLFTTTQPVDYILLTDGVSEISVYVARADDVAFPERLITPGGIAVARHRESGIDFTVVGKIPLETAIKISHSMVLKQTN